MAGGKKSGAKNNFINLIMIVLIIAVIFGWARVNNITSIQGAYEYFRAWSDKVDSKIAECQVGDIKWVCRTGESPSNPGSPPSTTSDGSGNTSSNGTTDGTSGTNGTTGDTTTNPTPTSSTAAPLSLDALPADFLKALEKLPTAEPQEITYSRAEWKHWVGEPCDTRRQALIRDGKNVQVTKTATTCYITSGTWTSPYDNKVFTDPSLLDIDHVVALSYAAKHGGQSWSLEKKQAFANDLSQLMSVSASENRGKGDSGPSEYMPPESGYQCTYSKIWVSTVGKYGLTITNSDKYTLQNALQKC